MKGVGQKIRVTPLSLPTYLLKNIISLMYKSIHCKKNLPKRNLDLFDTINDNLIGISQPNTHTHSELITWILLQMFVRLFVDENLDRHVPISKQPKEKIQAIIDSCTRQFPEFAPRARKRIRTYLKSCRRTKRSREQAGLDAVNVRLLFFLRW